MKRREFLKTSAAIAGSAILTNNAFAMANTQKGDDMTPAIPRRTLGKTGVKLSIIGFGGIVVMNAEPEHAGKVVAESVERGINYFDVAPSYGDAEIKLGPALEPFRENCFLACKTHLRDKAGAKQTLDQSLKNLKTDHFDLFQLHAITDVEKDVKAAFAKDGAMETILDAQKAGIIKYIGFSTHSEAAALAAMDLFDFDTILCPTNFCCHYAGNFEPKMLEEARKRNMGILTLKAMAKQVWLSDEGKANYPKCWYEPIDDPQLAQKALNWTLSQKGVTAALPPGEEKLFRIALDCVPQLGRITQDEQKELELLAKDLKPLFPQ